MLSRGLWSWIGVLLLSSGLASADLIEVVGGVQVEGEVLALTNRGVEYDPTGEVTFYVIPWHDILTVRYADGKTLLFDRLAQRANPAPTQPVVAAAPAVPKTPAEPVRLRDTLGLEAMFGWNSSVGGGVLLDLGLWDHLQLAAGLGTGMWGLRATGLTRLFFRRQPYGAALGFGYTYNGGGDTTVESTVDDQNATSNYTFDPVGTLNVFFHYAIDTNPTYTARLFFEVGYAFRFGEAGYQLLHGEALDDEVTFMQPGGVILAAGFGLGLL